MSFVYKNAVAAVSKPSLLVILCPEDQSGWCKQLAEEGYDVAHIFSLSQAADTAVEISKAVGDGPRGWAILTYGLKYSASSLLSAAPSTRLPQAAVHFCPSIATGDELLIHRKDKTLVPTLVHLASSQEDLHASIVKHSVDPGYEIEVSDFNPVTVQTYPKVSANPPFPFTTLPPLLQLQAAATIVDSYLRSAVGLSYTRSLELLKRHLGPHYDLEKLWEMHTYYEFAERDASKTMSTMVATPYVNHIPTMTGGLGHDELARFYKYHFTKENVTPPDTELITISRTVGADRIIDEMIFKCTHTTEIDYFLPGVAPTGKPLEIALVGVVAFRGDKLTFEHIYWDQASALVQLGLLSTKELPVAGVEVARKVVNPFGLPSNTLMAKWKESEGLPLTDD
ncbi:NTF2-like protein [Phanerochaete sordida]|uniref:NTF2-like protein n=1 Tax=Phanerochaete sordida TaxID=48140 RepID=A0A9P3L837_9APHY|nr:NTF2-like protein [Phanerochaete sordida]